MKKGYAAGMLRLGVALSGVVLFAACGALIAPQPDSGRQPIDAGTPSDAGESVDASVDDPVVDSGTPDSGTPDGGAADAGEPDAGTPDAGEPDAGVMTVDAGPCDGGFCAPELLAAERVDPWDLAVDDGYIYWLEYGLATNGLDGEVDRLAKGTTCLHRDAGCVEDLNFDFLGRFRVDTLTVAGENLCWTEWYAEARHVVCQSLVTNGERTMAVDQPAATRPFVVGDALYWVNQGTSAAASDGQLQRLSLSAAQGTSPTTLVDHRPFPGSATVAQEHLVWTELGVTSDAGAVWALPLDGGPAFALEGQLRAPLSVQRCGPLEQVRWVEFREGTVKGGALSPDSGVLLVTGQQRPFQLACDDTYLFWLNAGVSATGADGSLWRARLDGTGAEPMVRGIPYAGAMAIDAQYVYYLALGTQTRIDGRLYRIRKDR